MFIGQSPHHIVVDPAGPAIDAVMDKMVELPGKTHLGPMGQMPAMGQIHTQDRIPGLKQGEIGRHIGLGTGMGLNVDIIGAEQLNGPLDGQALGHIHEFAPAIVAFIRVALGILIGQQTALGRHDGSAGDIFRGNQLEVTALPLQFLINDLVNFRVHRRNIRVAQCCSSYFCESMMSN